MEDGAKDKEISPDAIAQCVERFCGTLRGLRTTFEITMPLIAQISISQDKSFEAFVKKHELEKGNDEEGYYYSVPIALNEEFKKHKRSKERLDVSYFHLPRALLVSLVSAYDSYLGDLVKALFALRPELIDSSNRQLTLKELSSFASIEAARDYLIGKEVESLIRDSHIKQFEWLENRFDVTLRKGLAAWKTFVEVTERRNLYVHCDGVVSDQYISNCEKHGVDITSVVRDKRLPEILPDYYIDAWECIYEIGVKLAHVLWRKLSKDLQPSDDSLIEGVYELLEEEDYRLAAELGKFSACVLPRHSNSLCRRTLLVNYCIALRLGGNENECMKVLDAEDWSDSDDSFRLANLVLRKDFQAAQKLMLEVGTESKRLSRRNYEVWPLFSEFRNSDEFKGAYKTLFGEEYKVPEEKAEEKQSPKRKKAAKTEKNSVLTDTKTNPSRRTRRPS